MRSLQPRRPDSLFTPSIQLYINSAMTRLLLFILLVTSSVFSFAQVHVRGYYRKNGTYVQPHERTRPNHTVTDNYSYPGNYNPNTGRITGGSTRNYSQGNTASSERTSDYTPSKKSEYTPATADQQYTPPFGSVKR